MSTDTATILFDNTSDANFRTWGSRISQMFATCGLVQTADTGQINWTTTTRVTTSGQENISGYEMWRFNDSLQATKPVFIKVEYGIVSSSVGGSPVPNLPVILVTTGTATNGAGTFTGTLTGSRQRLVGNTSPGGGFGGVGLGGAPNVASPCYGSGDGSFINLALGITAAAQPIYNVSAGNTPAGPFPAFFSVERSRNADGTANGDGIIMLTSHWSPSGLSTNPGNAIPTSQVTSFLSGYTISGPDGAWPISWPGSGFGTANIGGDVYFEPLLWATPKPEYQSLGWLGTWKNDVPLLSPMVVVVLGSAHTYLSMAGIAGTASANNARSFINSATPNGAVMMRYE